MIERPEELLERDTFHVWLPNVAVFKSEKTTDGQTLKRIGGMASTQRRDRQDEVLVQKGLDFSEFVDHGYFNDNHKQDTDQVVGIPELAKYLPGKGWYTEGYLIPNWPLADRIWGLAKALIGTKRRLGFSVEGKVKERGSDNKILRAIIRNVAITNRPVNTDCTFETLTKAFGTADEIAECYDAEGKACSCSSKKAVRKAVSAGSGSPLAAPAESDEESSDEEIEDEPFRQNLRRRGLSLEKGIEFLRRIRPGYSDTTLARIYLYAMKTGGH